MSNEVDIAKIFYEAEESEPQSAPTDEAVEENEPLEDEVESDDGEVVEESTEETEEIIEDAITLNGEEHNLDEIQEWKQAHDNVKLMQADCTKKWQEAADLRKQAEAEIAKNNELKLQLEVLVAEDEQVDMEDLKEYDEVEFYKLERKQEKRKAKLAELKANETKTPTLSDEEIVAEREQLFGANPKWVDKEGKHTKQYEDDMKAVSEYASKLGYTQDELNGLQRSRHWLTMLDAARYQQAKSKGNSITKKVRSAPKVTKPKATAKSTKDIPAEKLFYG